MCTLEKRIRDLIHFYVKENYNHYLQVHNIPTIQEKDIPQVVEELYGQKKEHIHSFHNISSIQEMDNEVYVAGDMGIVKFNTQRREWELVTAPGVYGNEMVYSMANNDKFLFLGTIKGLYRINKKSGLVRDYQYAFIGQVNDIILEDNIIWLGTINGLLRFKWKRDL